MILKRNVYHHSRDIRYKSLVCNLIFLPCCHVPSVSCFRDKSSVREQFETNVVTQDMPAAIHTYITSLTQCKMAASYLRDDSIDALRP